MYMWLLLGTFALVSVGIYQEKQEKAHFLEVIAVVVSVQ